MDGMQHEQFIKALNGLVELAKTRKMSWSTTRSTMRSGALN